MGDGNGWVSDCSCGGRHWGRFGAAGLLVTDGERVLLQHRAVWTHQGGTWGVPGGARDSHEAPVTAALREAGEETTLDLDEVTPYAELVDEHGQWSYTTIVARTRVTGAVAATNHESTAIQWWPIDEVPRLELHPGFAATWPQLRPLLADERSGRSGTPGLT